MKYFQYTGSQPETGMVVMEVEMVSGTNFYQFSIIVLILMSTLMSMLMSMLMLMVSSANFYPFSMLMLILMLMLMVSGAKFYQFSINIYPPSSRFFFILFPFKRTLRWEAKTNSS